ncbi:MAG TPA: thermonuclease family protein [Candidatus Krumholzibacteria bacterium]|nr:thermonuclease family protein [Candidatus Krumholzibacteria bacterium]
MIRRMQLAILRPMAWLAVAVAGGGGCRRDHGSADAHASYHHAQVVDVAQIEFDDGDTFLYRREPIRVLGIDTPEVAEPDVGIFEDQPYGRAAAESTQALITRAHRVEIAYDGRDIYRRRLAHVFVDGELLGVKLLQMGLAYENVSHFGDNGFPDLADRILRAAHEGPKPPFEPPYQWRRKNQKKKTNE